MIKLILGSFLIGALVVVAYLQFSDSVNAESEYEKRVNELPSALIDEKKRLMKMIVNLKDYEESLFEEPKKI